MSEQFKKVKIKQLAKEDNELWYYDHQGKEFPLFVTLDTGQVVINDDGKGNVYWLVRTEHCEIID